MRKLLLLVLFLSLMSIPACAQEWTMAPDGWVNMAYVYGGIDFIVPEDFETWELYQSEMEMGYILMGANPDFTLQIRGFTPEQITVEAFQEMLEGIPDAEMSLKETETGKILYYQNTAPTSDSELFGIVMDGIDGNIYKISIFTGEDGDCSKEAKVWSIAQAISQSVNIKDFSQIMDIEQSPQR